MSKNLALASGFKLHFPQVQTGIEAETPESMCVNYGTMLVQ